MSGSPGPHESSMLRRRGLMLEHLTLAWNVAGAVVIALAAGKRATGRRLANVVLQTQARVTVIDGALAAAVLLGVMLDATVGWWWADPLSALVILVCGVREARHAWPQAG